LELIIENIRCFSGRHTIPIKPITFLTGENSSGKTTVLAALAAANDFGFPLRPRFNKTPYSLGNYDTIATYKGGRYGRSKTFSLGYKEDRDYDDRPSKVVATYREKQGASELSALSLTNAEMDVNLTLRSENRTGYLHIELTTGEAQHNFDTEFAVDTGPTSWPTLDGFLFRRFIRNSPNEKVDARIFDLGIMLDALSRVPAVSIAPVRTKPSRTYDQIVEDFSPEGEHIPFVLSEVLEVVEYRRILERFGQEAGLFRQIEVKRLGSKISDPVQIMVANSGRAANLVDVGYGVSQSLPVVVESMLIAPERLLLLQQPEVHLHPRAQAALGSLFVDLHVENKKQFVVETHSDYIIDRVRQEVARGRVRADEVQILYFGKEGSETTVYPIALDKQGNIVDAPPSYRDFFFQEEVNLLSR